MRKLLLFVCICLVAVLPASVLAQSNPDALVYSLVGGDISTLNPAMITDGNSNLVSSYIFEGLFRADPDSGLPTPALATWKVSDDGLTYTFTLKDAKWSDGTPITAKDVKFTYDAIMSPKVESPRKADVAAIASVEAKDDKTVVVTLKEANCTIWGNGFSVLVPLPSHKFAADFSDFMTSKFNTAPDVASGPYIYDDRKTGEFVRLKANPTYHQGAPKIPTFVFRIIADPATVNQSLQTGTVDYAFMYPDQLEQLQGKDKFNTFLFPNNNTPIVVMNYQDSSDPQPAYDKDGKPNTLKPNKFFGDVRVRQAVAMGYDKNALAQTQGENSGSEPLSGPITPAFYSTYDMSGIKPWPYDPEKAKQLLDEAGWKLNESTGIREKDGQPFEVNLVYSQLVDLWTNTATVLQDQLGQIGIKVNVSTMEWSAYLSNVLLPAKFDMTIVGFGGGTEVDGIAYNLLYSKNVNPGSGFNLAAYVNPKMDELLDQARTMPGCSTADRAKLYQQVQQLAHDDVPYDWVVSTTQVNVLNKRVTDARYGQWNPTPIIGWGLSG
jgi:peptide/nickel transport system substrate-binding protein